MRALIVLILTILTCFHGVAQSKSIEEAVKTLSAAFNTGDSATFNKIIPSPSLFKELYEPDSLTLAAMSEEDRQFTQNIDHTMMHQTRFIMERFKLMTFQIQISLEDIIYEKEKFSQVLEMAKPLTETYLISIPLAHNQFKWLQFTLTKVGEFWYSLAPFYRVSETRKKLD